MKKVLALQGGGSWTSFTAGTLQELARNGQQFQSFSGSSGGSIAGLIYWLGSAKNDFDFIEETFDVLWDNITVKGLLETYFLRSFLKMYEFHKVSPIPLMSVKFDYLPKLKTILENTIDFDECRFYAEKTNKNLYVGSVNLRTGKPKIFTQHNITSDMILASSSLPQFCPPVEIDGEPYADGLYSQNPPVLPFFTETKVPTEIVLVKIDNIEEFPVPKTKKDIEERLMGLTSVKTLETELNWVENVFPNTIINTIQLDPKETGESSRIDTHTDVISKLRTHGKNQAINYLKKG